MNTNIKLIHNLGNNVPKTFLGRHYIISNYPAFRLYYIFRNNIIIKRLYSNLNTPEIDEYFHGVISFHAFFAVYIKRIILFEGKKLPKIASIVRGIINGFLYKIE